MQDPKKYLFLFLKWHWKEAKANFNWKVNITPVLYTNLLIYNKTMIV